MVEPDTREGRMGLKEPDKIDRVFMWLMQNSKRANTIIEEAIGEAYDMGFQNGLMEGAKRLGGKKYMNKVKKALKQAYLVPKAKS